MTTFQELFETVHFSNPIAALWFPIFLMLVDFLTGYINACIKGTKSSSKMREGGGKKFAEAMCICVAQMATYAMNVSDKLVYLVSFYIIYMELVSIIENIKLLGVKVPADVDDTIGHVNDDLDKTHDDKKDEGE